MTEEEGAPLDIKFQQRFSKNLISNVVYFIINVLIGLALVPFFLDTLGESAYALIPLATSLTSYVTLVIDSVNTSISRFLTIDLQRADMHKANETYNTALFGTLGIIFLLVPVAIIVAWFIPSLFQIGEQTPVSVFWLFSLIFGSMFIRSWSSNFMVTLFAYNRLDLRNYVNVANIVIQFCLIIVFFIALRPTLELVGLSYFIAAICALLLAYFFSRKVCPQLIISLFLFNKKRMVEIGGLSLWVIFNTIGALLYTQIALILVNVLCGETAEAQYAIVYTWFTLLYAIGGLITNAFTPMIYSHYSKNDISGLIRFTTFSTKVVGLFMALPIGLVCVFGSQLLTLWVGEKYSSLSLLLCIIVMPVIIHIQASCSYAVYISTKQVRLPAIANIVTGGIVIGLSMLLVYLTDLEIYGVALSVGTGLILRQGIFNPIYTAYVLKAPIKTYFKSIWGGAAGLAGLMVMGMTYTSIIPVNSLFILIISAIIISIIYLIIIINIVLKKNERLMIRGCMPKFIQENIPSWLL